MGKLEDLKRELFDSYKDNFVIYEVNGGEVEVGEAFRRSVEWIGGDYSEFLSYAERLGAKIIYYWESFSTNEHTENPVYNEEIADMDIGFVYDEVLHNFRLENESTVPEQNIVNLEREKAEIDAFGHKMDTIESLKRKTAIKELDERPPDELAKEMIEFAYKEFPDSLTSFYEVANAFWESKGLNFIGAVAKNRIKMERVKEIAEKEIMNILVNKEKEQLPKIIEDCISWAKENRFNKLTRANMQAFLLEKRLNITYFTQDALYVRVNFELKKKKL